MSYFQRIRPEYRRESFNITGTQKKINCFSADNFCAQCNTVFEAIGCFYLDCSCQETRSSLTEENIEGGNIKRLMDEMRRQRIKDKRLRFCQNVEK